MKDRRFFYQTIADKFDVLMNPYDLQRRLSILFDELLPENLSNLRVLDLGCGTGWFSHEARKRGAQIISVDISPALAAITHKRTSAPALTADAVLLPFASQSFDVIISSEMLEHLEKPELGLKEIVRLLVPGGKLALTTPNRRWLWLVQWATQLRLRPFEGYEVFLEFDEIHSILISYGLAIQRHTGFHPWPFQIKFLQALSQQVDNRFGSKLWGAWMINQAISAIKPE